MGARTCIFRVGGLINFPCESCYSPLPPNLTIAGQTAPGDGIMIRNMQLELRNTHDIIIRHLRVRPSEDIPVVDTGGAISAEGQLSGSPAYTHDIIVDHFSAGWAPDDSIGGFKSYNVTFQWGIVSEGLDVVDVSKVGLWNAEDGEGNGTVSILHNYFANHNYRSLAFQAGDGQFVNNVLYNIASILSMYAYPVHGFRVRMEMFNNYFHAGPDSSTDAPQIATLGCGYDLEVECPTAANSSINVHGNVHSTLRPSAASGSETAMVARAGSPLIAQTTSATTVYGFPTIPSQTSAAQARTDVLAKAGAYAIAGGVATVRRDSIDQRSIDDLADCADADGSSCTGRMDAAAVSTYGGYPTYNSGTPYTDTDGDGISDSWETAHGLNPNDASDGPALHANGWSNLENFLNELAGDTVFTSTPAPLVLRLVR